MWPGSHHPLRFGPWLSLMLGLTLASLASAPPALADIAPSRDSSAVATAITDALAPGVFSTASFSVIPPPPSATSECQDGLDNDEDGKIDFTPPPGLPADPDCQSAGDNREQGDAVPQCSNGIDDDGDAKVDFTPPAGQTADAGCASAQDDLEEDAATNPTPQCSNGVDDDGDDKVDFTSPAGQSPDLGCSSAGDLDEGSEGLPVGQDTNPAAVSTSPLAGFPTSGSSYAVLSSGDATFADDPNDSGATGQANNGDGGTHGASFFDLVTLKINVSVPVNANCISIDFKFLSEEFPEFVGGTVNDGFIAELDISDFTADPAMNNKVIAPHNFAFDQSNNVISINTAGFSAADAAGTTYDGATPVLRASTPVTPGAHTIYLSVFDQGDSVLDSAAFLDNLRVYSAPAGSCIAGATSDRTPPDTTITAGPTGTTADDTPTFEFSSTEPGSTFECRVDSAAFASCTSQHTTAALSTGSHTLEVRAIDPAGNVDPTPATRAFTVVAPDTAPPDTTPPETRITGGPAGPTNDSTPTFTFVSNEAGSTFQCSIDNGPFIPCSSPFTLPPLSKGAHTFQVRAVDRAGNVDPSPASTFDTGAAHRLFTVVAAIAKPNLGRSVNAVPVGDGPVFVSIPPGRARASASVPGIKGRMFVPLSEARSLPVGSIFDTREGTVRLTSARNSAGATQSGDFRAGVFQVLQSRKRSARGLTELRLKGASFRLCGARRRGRSGSAQVRAARRARTVRRLRGNGKGRFKTRGRYSSATVRGTEWTVFDRCDGTLTKVRRGTVVVRDFRRRTNVTVRAGRKYLARAPTR